MVSPQPGTWNDFPFLLILLKSKKPRVRAHVCTYIPSNRVSSHPQEIYLQSRRIKFLWVLFAGGQMCTRVESVYRDFISASSSFPLRKKVFHDILFLGVFLSCCAYSNPSLKCNKLYSIDREIMWIWVLWRNRTQRSKQSYRHWRVFKINGAREDKSGMIIIIIIRITEIKVWLRLRLRLRWISGQCKFRNARIWAMQEILLILLNNKVETRFQ